MLINKILADARGKDEITLLSPSKGEAIHVHEDELKKITSKKEIEEYPAGLCLRI